MSYRQLAQYILTEYGAIAAAQATPLFTGNGLDTPVLGQRGVPVRQWPLQVRAPLSIEAGSLSGVETGSLLALVPGPLARAEDAIGYLEASAAQADRAELVPVAHGGRAAPAAGALREGQYVRLVSGPPQFSLRVAADTRGCGADCSAAIALLQRQGVPGVEAVWVDAGTGADLTLRAWRDQLVFLAPAQAADDPRAPPPALALREAGGPVPAAELATRIAGELHGIARARNLLRVAAQLAADTPGDALVVGLQRRSGRNGAPQPVAAESLPRLRDGDRLALTVENRGRVALDLTLLYLDADQGITALFPSGLGESNRVDAGAVKTIDDIEIHTPPAGIERLVLIAVEARRLGERADFSFLQQPALARRRSATADEPDVFADAGFADYRTRGAARPAAPRRGTFMRLFSLDVGRAAPPAASPAPAAAASMGR